MEDDADLLAEQRAYYRARSSEYDEWWQRRGRYDRGEDERVEWDRQVAVLDEALADFGATGRVLELAGGTGWWTERLARTADELTVVDASAETLEQKRGSGRPGRCQLRHRRRLRLASGAAVRRRVLLVLAVARAEAEVR